MTAADIYQKCGLCNGTGVVTINDEPYDSGPPEEVECPNCKGTGENQWGDVKEENGG